jgi:hypothetical protein
MRCWRFWSCCLTLSFSLLISACGGGGGGGGNSSGGNSGGGNASPPIADAGADFDVLAGQLVTLDGSNSYDPQGQTVSYQWTQIAGPAVKLLSAYPARPRFIAPPAATTLVFQLVVSVDDRVSAPAKVTVTVGPLPYSAATVIDASGGQRRLEGVRTAADRASGQVMALLVAIGQSTDDAEQQPHLYSSALTGSSWSSPVQIDGAPVDGVVPGDIAFLGNGRYIVAWIEIADSLWPSYYVKARFFDPATGWGEIQTAVYFAAPITSLKYAVPVRVRVGADPATGNAFIVWQNAFDGIAFVDYRAASGKWGEMRGIGSGRDEFVEWVCDGARCVLLTRTESGAVFVAHYDQATGNVSFEVLDPDAGSFAKQRIAATAHGIYVIWAGSLDQMNGFTSLVMRRLPPGTRTWASKQTLYTSPAGAFVGSTPRLTASTTGAMTALFTQHTAGASGDALLALTYNPAAQNWSAAEVVRVPPAPSGGQLQLSYVNETDLVFTLDTEAGLVAQRYVAGAGWQAETLIDTNRALQVDARHLIGGLPGGAALSIFNAGWVVRFNRMTSSGWAGSQTLPALLPAGSGKGVIATAPDGTTVAAWTQWRLLDRAVMAAFKPPGGTWQAPVELTAAGDDVEGLRLTHAGAGRFVAAWTVWRSDSPSRLFAATFSVNSSTWSPVAAGSDAVANDDLAIAGDGAGGVLATWTRAAFNGAPTLHAATFNGAWGATSVVNSDSGEAGQAAVAADGAGSFTVVWKERTTGRVRARGYNAAAAVWSTITNLETSAATWTSGAPETRVAVASAGAGDLMACWHSDFGTVSTEKTSQLRCARATGGVWSTTMTLDTVPFSPGTATTAIGRPDVIADGVGRYALGWRRYPPTYPPAPGEWRAARFMGGAWQAPTILYAKSPQDALGFEAAIEPSLVRDGNGNLLVVWADNPTGLSRANGFAAYFSAAPGTWQPTHFLEVAPGKVGLVAVAARAGSGFELLWAQADGSRTAMHAGARD